MGKRPSSSHSLDRKDNTQGYSKDNCRWATLKEQANNTSGNKKILFRGVEKTVAEWAETLGLHHEVIRGRMKLGWTDPEKILSTKKYSNRGVGVAQILNGRTVATFANIKGATEATGLGYAALAKCLCGGNKTCGGFQWTYITK
jgi:hypothetical protein